MVSSSASDAETSLPKETRARGNHGAVFEGLMPIRTLLFSQGKAKEALQALKTYQFKRGLATQERRAVLELVGLSHRTLHEWKLAQQAFGEIPDPYQAGYCALLSGDVATAIRWWQPLIQKVNPNHWALCLVGMVTGQMQRWPSMLQIRNYLEQDVYALAEAGQEGLLNNVLACAPILLQINPEAPKMMGRSLLYAQRVPQALTLLLLGQRTLPQDSEVYFHLGQCYASLSDWLQARRCLNQCLMINSDYKPAQWLLDKAPATDNKETAL